MPRNALGATPVRPLTAGVDAVAGAFVAFTPAIVPETCVPCCCSASAVKEPGFPVK